MKIGWLGLGKLGLPITEAIADKGHEVKGYDVLPKELPKTIQASSVQEIVGWADLIFAAPQTPHSPEYEGITRLPDTRADFDYSYLIACVKYVAAEALVQKRHINLVVISTCLPGTFAREVRPLLNEYVNYIYEPLFIAMGTEKADFLNPEFVVMGGVDLKPLKTFYKTIHDKPLVETDIVTAEGIKVSYNTWITAKTVIANTWGEIVNYMGMNFEDMYKAWSLATDRILSNKYMRPGMSDGGPCHPRDNIALSYLAREIGVSHDIFSDLMKAREDYEERHALKAMQASKEYGLPLIILGRAFKPETDIEAGSAALLLANILVEKGQEFEHYEDLDKFPKAVYFIATDHKKYNSYKFPTGSVVINPSHTRAIK